MDLFARVAQFEETFRSQGWAVWQMDDAAAIEGIHENLEKHLNQILGQTSLTLENYHRHRSTDDQHYKIQYEMTKYFRENKFAKRVIASQVEFFRRLLGPDLLVQRNPYLRVTRPNSPTDNIGFHRDTFYGGSPYELSCVIPFVDVPAEASLGFVTGSHVHSEEMYPVEQTTLVGEENVKGSMRHQMGFLYAPKKIRKDLSSSVTKVGVKMGQILIFSLATVHGSEVNTSPGCRWSTDTRVLNRYFPVDLSARPDYYEDLSFSVVSETSRLYQANQTSYPKDLPATL